MSSDSSIVIGRPVYRDGRYEIPFVVPERLRKFFRSSTFWFECPDADEVPGAIAAVPAVANLIPFAWVFDCSMEVAVLDEAFCGALPRIKQGYADMLPKLRLAGSLKVSEVVGCGGGGTGSPLMLFSGGVDAWCTLVRHVEERPHLVTVWGADIGCENEGAWAIVDGHSRSVAKSLGVSYSYVKSNLRGMIDYRALDGWLDAEGVGYTWWHDLQHGIGLLSLSAPLAYATGARCTYIASSFSEGDRGQYVCASDPTIDNKFTTGQMRGCHDGYELTRQDKMDTIVDYVRRTGSTIELRVCFHVQTGKNCCRCEKCGRTILGIYAAGGNPRDFGFSYSPAKLNMLSFRMRHFYKMRFVNYRCIRQGALRHRDNVPACLSWIFSDDLEGICDNGFKRAWERFHAFGAGLYHGLVG